ncbi:DUF4333 domain-containing protein [Pseudonocardia sp.]|uniref:DUF4333 domain-containing protein n=1 Tax=Pseudonocardia sp. TaxID=60912 RepID=UPI00260BBECE|nr:DUF4333 domain-containing protein [Pseudonocardia sp.]
MTTPEGPAHGNPADRPAWGTPPAGGWGERPSGAAQARSWSEDGAPAEPQRAESGGATAGTGRPEPDGSVTRIEQPGSWGPPNGPAPNGPAPGVWGPTGGSPAGGVPPQWGPNPQAPAWAQQPPPSGGWAPAPQQPYPGGPQPAYPGAPHQWGPPGYPPLPGPPSGPPRRSRTPLVVGAVVLAAVALVALLAFVAPGFAYTTVFDRVQLQAGVQRVLVEDYRYSDVGEVVCGDPAAAPITVRTGATFTCTTTIEGVPATVPVTVTSDDGGYDVSRPA